MLSESKFVAVMTIYIYSILGNILFDGEQKQWNLYTDISKTIRCFPPTPWEVRVCLEQLIESHCELINSNAIG